MSRFADVPSDTPHGPRPVPEGHLDTDQMESRLKRHRKPRGPNLMVLGGVGLAAAVTVLAARAVADALTGDDEDRPRRRPVASRDRLPPRFADMDEEERRALRARARAGFTDYEDHAAELRAEALRERREKERLARRRHRSKARRSFFDDLSGSASRLATNITALIAAANAAADGFQQVSGKADGIMRDFGQAADRVRNFFDAGATGNAAPSQPSPPPAPRQTAGHQAQAPVSPDAAEVPTRRDRTHNL